MKSFFVLTLLALLSLVLSSVSVGVFGQTAPGRSAPTPGTANIRITPIYQGVNTGDSMRYFAIVRGADGNPEEKTPVTCMTISGPQSGTTHTQWTDASGLAVFDFIAPSKVAVEAAMFCSFIDAAGVYTRSEESEYYTFAPVAETDGPAVSAAELAGVARSRGNFHSATIANGTAA